MSVEAMKLARNFIKFNTGSSHYVIEQLDQAIAKAEKQPKRNVATPREWVGLTEEKVIDLWPDLIMHKHTYQFWQNLEAELKELNT